MQREALGCKHEKTVPEFMEGTVFSKKERKSVESRRF
jgi:hypothetical protein